jgi:putative oxidoreductase
VTAGDCEPASRAAVVGLALVSVQSMLRWMKVLHLNFLPRSSDAALLLLRVWYGASILLVPGMMKLKNFSSMASQFPDLLGIGAKTSLILVIFAEVFCAALLVIGLFTRVAALILAFTMGVAFWMAHGAKLSGDNNGMPAFLYLGAFVALFIAGAGKFSVDAKMGAKT